MNYYVALILTMIFCGSTAYFISGGIIAEFGLGLGQLILMLLLCSVAGLSIGSFFRGLID